MNRTKYKKQIKESFDNLPTGIIFAKKNGIILLANKKMYEIYNILTGEILQSANSFWESLKNENNRVKIIESGSKPTLVIDDNKVYNFTKNLVNIEGKEIVQVDAVDISKLYELRQELIIKNNEIVEIRRKMFETNENLEKLITEEEKIDARIKIHRIMGTGLANIRHYLETGQGDIDKSLTTWKSSMNLLGKDESFKRFKQEESLRNAASSLGIKLVLNGEFPTNKKLVKTIVWAAKECLINAMVHADAEKMYIDILENKYSFIVRFTNDGKNETKDLRPGGGFASIRKAVLNVDGSFTYATKGQFYVEITLPK